MAGRCSATEVGAARAGSGSGGRRSWAAGSAGSVEGGGGEVEGGDSVSTADRGATDTVREGVGRWGGKEDLAKF